MSMPSRVYSSWPAHGYLLEGILVPTRRREALIYKSVVKSKQESTNSKSKRILLTYPGIEYLDGKYLMCLGMNVEV